MKFRIALVFAGLVVVGGFASTRDLTALFSALPISFGPYLDLQGWQWVALAVLAGVSAVVSYAVSAAAAWIGQLRGPATESRPASGARVGAMRAIGLLAGTAIFWTAQSGLTWPDRWQHALALAIQGIGIAGSIWLVYSLWDGLCDALADKAASTDRRAEKLLVPVTRKLVRFIIVLGGSLVGLAWMGANVAGVLAGLGIGGLAVALAAKDSVENVFGSLTILFDMPFGIGDWVKIGPVDGVVEEINLRSTRIRTFEDSVVTLPNSNLIRASVENFGARRYRRVRLQFTIPMQVPEEALAGFCAGVRAALAAGPHVREEGLVVSPHDVNDQGVVILAQCFVECETFEAELAERAFILREIARAAREFGIRTVAAPLE